MTLKETSFFLAVSYICLFSIHAGVWLVCLSFVQLVESSTFVLDLTLCLRMDDVCICTVSANEAPKKILSCMCSICGKMLLK